MATPNEKLAESLQALHELNEVRGLVAIKTSDLSRTHRERLIKNGFLREVTKGWYISTPPLEQKGVSTSWYMSYWKFCSRYLEDKYGDQYCISAEQSVMIHAGNNTVPHQLIVRSPNAPNLTIELLYQTSLYIMKSQLPAKEYTTDINGIRMLTLPSALIRCSPIKFEKNPIDMRIALALIGDSSEILRPLLDGSHSTVAGRLAGAFRNIGRDRTADEIVKVMKSVGFDVREEDPFTSASSYVIASGQNTPYANRLKLMWDEMRKVVLQYFPATPGLPNNHELYLKSIDEIYVMDAYHSLSIEQYVVSAELINKVKIGKWDVVGNTDDKKQRDAMAARGYWQASQIVKKSIEKILKGANAGKVVDQDHGDWYMELFAPSVTAGLLKASDLAGYRTNQVYISQSMHVPLNKDAVRGAMTVLFELLHEETHPGVRSVLGHFMFVYIHPYMDGNGRMARFLMNVMLASGGYPWTVIPVEERDTYMTSLEKASVGGDIEAFAKFITHLVRKSMEGNPVAKMNG